MEEVKRTNLEKLRQIYDSNKGSNNSNINWWRPAWGDNIIRVLPPINEDDVFFFEVARHRVNNEWYYCLKYKKDPKTGKSLPCPICEYRTKLFRSGDLNFIKIAKEIKPRKQFLMNIIDRKAEDQTKVYVYSAGIKMWNKMVSTMLDEDIDITDVENGFDFLIKKEEGPKTEFGQFPSYDNSKAKRKSSPLHEDPEITKKILKSRYVLSEIPTFESPEVLRTVVEEFVQNLTKPVSEEFYQDEVEEQEIKPKQQKVDINSFKEKLKKQLRAEEDEEEFDNEEDE